MSICTSCNKSTDRKCIIFQIPLMVCQTCEPKIRAEFQRIYDTVDPYKKHRDCDCKSEYMIASPTTSLSLIWMCGFNGLESFKCKYMAHAIAVYISKKYNLSGYSIINKGRSENSEEAKLDYLYTRMNRFEDKIVRLENNVSEIKDMLTDFMRLLSTSKDHEVN